MALIRPIPVNGSLADLFPVTMSAYSNGTSGSNGEAKVPIFLKGINTINVTVSDDTSSLSSCKYSTNSDYSSGTAFSSTNFNINVSSYDTLYFTVANSFTTGEHKTTVTITIVD